MNDTPPHFQADAEIIATLDKEVLNLRAETERLRAETMSIGHRASQLNIEAFDTFLTRAKGAEYERDQWRRCACNLAADLRVARETLAAKGINSGWGKGDLAEFDRLEREASS
jgi:hypothetical protein